jgi:hypothetical protein
MAHSFTLHQEVRVDRRRLIEAKVARECELLRREAILRTPGGRFSGRS